MPRCFCSWRSRLSTCARMDISSALIGSSATMNSGSTISARAIPMRWRCPPENSWGKREANSGSRPTSNSACRTFFLPLRGGKLRAHVLQTLAHDVAYLGALVQGGLRVLKDHLNFARELLIQRTGNFAVDALTFV